MESKYLKLRKAVLIDEVVKYHKTNKIIYDGIVPITINSKLPEVLVDFDYYDKLSLKLLDEFGLNKPDLNEYYDSLYSSDMKWINLEGWPFYIGYYKYKPVCDYCKRNDDVCYPKGSHYWCKQCKYHICEICYKKSPTCVQHNIQLRDPYVMECSICKKIDDKDLFIESKNTVSSTNRITVCIDCAAIKEGCVLIKIYGLEFVSKLKSWWDYTGLENIIDWVPIFERSDGLIIFQNLNPNSDNYKSLALSNIDAEGYRDFLTIPSTFKEFAISYIRESHTH
jgi:hypothetical protein